MPNQPLCQQYDVGLFDLDGVIYAGDDAIEHAAQSVDRAAKKGLRVAFVTNNAARTPEQVRDKLRGFSVEAQIDQIISSALVAADILKQRLAPGAKVLVVGAEGLRSAVRDAGLSVVDSADDHPEAVVQGYGPDVGWPQLAEAVVAARAGALYVATNMDSTLPSARGILPGNGALIQAVVTALGRQPDLVAGKPDRAMQTSSVQRTGAKRPLVIGDRLDTDIEGAVNSGCDSLLVFTGVSTPADVLVAPPEHRPTHMSVDLRGLNEPARLPVHDGQSWTLGGWSAAADGQINRIDRAADSDSLDYLRVACAASWSGQDVTPADEDAKSAHDALKLK